jgi:glycosyltransferase involved in cell wall biosynthesis
LTGDDRKVRYRRLRIVFISDWFAENMGYAENCLPKAIASLGEEVHVVSANVQPYWDSPSYASTYQSFLGPPVVGVGETSMDGFRLHRLSYGRLMGRLRIRGLLGKLRALRPDVVQTFDVAALSSYEAALGRPLVGYRLFAESHLHASVFGQKPRWQLQAAHYCGRAMGLALERCYAISSDVADIAVKHLGMPADKVEICSLGVDTQAFRPADDPAARQATRQRLGFSSEEIVCIYTGRFASEKGPQVLADAVERLGPPFRGLFVGGGTASEVAGLRNRRGCVVHPFVAARDLPALYQAAEIGVWPRQESTSQLDAAACGLPIVISDRVHVTERVEGNGLTHREGDVEDLAARLNALSEGDRRNQLGRAGARKMRERFSWLGIAAARVRAYQHALG